MLGGLRMPELIVIGLIILFIFGAKKIPEMGKGLGEGIKNFKKSIRGGEDSKEKEKDDDKNDKKSA
jgi:sec-independent protein translocase protein TatA